MTNKLYIFTRIFIGSFFSVILLIAVSNLFVASVIEPSFAAGAPPGNDGICSATTLLVDGTCEPGETNVDATGDIYGGCVGSNYPSVWYTFSLSGSNNAVDITFTSGTFGGDGIVNTFLLSGTCASPGGISTVCEVWTSTFEFTNLSTGVTYFFEVATQPGANQGSYNICATQKLNVGAKTGPEQDCEGAIPVCASTYIMSGAYTGFGDKQEVNTGSCMKSGETNSVWFIFTAQTAGALDFTITTTKDYDFALYNITNIGCAGIPSQTGPPGTNPVRCNWSGILGPTGLVDAPNVTELPALSVDAMGTPTMAGIDVMVAGETYVLVVDNWTGDNTGFTLNFGSSPIVDVTDPTIISPAVASCTDNTILITMSEDIKCLSVIPTGFTLFNNTTATNFTSAITNLVGYNCPITDDALTRYIQITHNGTLTSGNYTITFNPPTPNDKCGRPVAGGSTVSFDYLADITLTPATATICTGGSVTLDANGIDATPPAHTYTLNPGGLTNTTTGIFAGLTPATTTTYSVSVTYGGCTKTASSTVTVENSIVATIDPMNPTICPGTTVLTAAATINGSPCVGCTFAWTGSWTGSGTSTPPVGAGTYTVTPTTGNGCVGTAASSTVTIASGAGTNCNVYYVNSYNGAGDCLTKTTPGGLLTALALASAVCADAIVKMSVGIYTFPDAAEVKSYVTVEGGYDAAFTIKSSNLTGAANSTTIRRTNASDVSSSTKCSAFSVPGGQTQFRFQDLRIELPGSPNVTGHAIGSGKSNYGIRIGAGCSSYNIVRCYIDAGKGAD